MAGIMIAENFNHQGDFRLTFKLLTISVFSGALFLFVFIGSVRAVFGDCPAGYRFDRLSGVGCVQTNCASIPSAHYSYEGYCICGSAGSINENPADPNKRCTLAHDNAGCPDCVYACVHNEEDCPGATPAAGSTQPPAESNPPAPSAEQPIEEEQPPAEVPANEIPSTPPAPTTNVPASNANSDQAVRLSEEMQRINRILSGQLAAGNLNNSKIVTAGLGWESVKDVTQRGFGVMMEMLGWGLDKTVGWELIQDKEDKRSGWAGLLVSSDGDYVDVKIFEGKLSFNWDDGAAAEFNLISVKGRPGSSSFVDGFSIGIGPGAVNGHEGDHGIPGTPVAPNINFDNIKNYFGEKWDGVKSWWQENVPWPLGGVSAPAIGGGE